MMTEEKADMLSSCKMKSVHFAWDKYEDKDMILPKLKLFGSRTFKGKTPDHNAIVYTLTNFNTTIKQDLERIYTLRELGYWAYVMIYQKYSCDRIYVDLQRWVNNRFIFATCPTFDEYLKRKELKKDTAPTLF